MIVSASRRTDIPALYAEWFANRIRAGYCTVPNPFNFAQVARVSLRPADVEAIVFWTRHARPLFTTLPLLDALGIRYYFQYTVTGYGRPIEARNPPLDVAIRTFRDLAARLPLGAVVWRYDPVVVGPAFPAAGHLERFARIARALEGRTRRVVVSVLHRYRKTERRVGEAYAWGLDLAREPAADPALPPLLGGIACVARDHGMTVESCAAEEDYSALGIGKGRCVDDRLLSELFGLAPSSRKDPGQRPACGCIASKDIGIPDTCTLGCLYCYATRSDDIARRRRLEHDPHSPSLFGRFELEPMG